jgi:hypothetical protein
MLLEIREDLSFQRAVEILRQFSNQSLAVQCAVLPWK